MTLPEDGPRRSKKPRLAADASRKSSSRCHAQMIAVPRRPGKTPARDRADPVETAECRGDGAARIERRRRRSTSAGNRRPPALTPDLPMRSVLLKAGDVAHAAAIYDALLNEPALDHAAGLRLCRGLVRYARFRKGVARISEGGRDRRRRRAISLSLRSRAVRNRPSRRCQARAGRGDPAHHG